MKNLVLDRLFGHCNVRFFFRSTSEVVGAVLAGADHVSVPLGLLLALGDHPLSEQAIAEFAQAGR